MKPEQLQALDQIIRQSDDTEYDSTVDENILSYAEHRTHSTPKDVSKQGRRISAALLSICITTCTLLAIHMSIRVEAPDELISASTRVDERFHQLRVKDIIRSRQAPQLLANGRKVEWQRPSDKALLRLLRQHSEADTRIVVMTITEAATEIEALLSNDRQLDARDRYQELLVDCYDCALPDTLEGFAQLEAHTYIDSG